MKKIIFVVLLVLSGAVVHAEDQIVAKVNGSLISIKDVESEVNRLISTSFYHGNVSEEKRGELRDKALDSLIERELQYQDALARGMKPDKQRVKEEMKRIRDKFKSKKEYKAALEKAGITEDQLRGQVEKGVLIQDVVNKSVIEPAHMSDEALKEHFEGNKSQYTQPESVKIRIISTRDRAKAEEAKSNLKAGEEFGAVAAKMSEDQYRVTGGDAGFIRRGKMFPVVEAEAFKMKPGEVSDLIKGEGIWFIVKVEEKQPERQLSFDEVRADLKKELESRRKIEFAEKWSLELHQKANIETSPKQQ